MTDDELLGIDAAAEVLNVNPRTLRRFVRDGVLPREERILETPVLTTQRQRALVFSRQRLLELKAQREGTPSSADV